jgi:hypothetical protein
MCISRSDSRPIVDDLRNCREPGKSADFGGLREDSARPVAGTLSGYGFAYTAPESPARHPAGAYWW